MDVPLEIAFRNMDSAPAVETRIREKVEWLSQYFGHITSCRVTVEMPHRHSQKGQIPHIRIEIGLPGEHDVVVNREAERDHAHEDIMIAIRDAFDKARRRLQGAAAKLEGDVKAHSTGGAE